MPCETPHPVSQTHPRIVVCDDAIRLAITGDRFNFLAESQVYALKYGMIRTMMEQGYEVMVDDTHTTATSIQRLVEINLNATFMLIDTDVDECIQRAKDTKQEDLVGVIHRHHCNLLELIGVEKTLPKDLHLSMALGYRLAGIRDDVVAMMEHTKRV